MTCETCNDTRLVDDLDNDGASIRCQWCPPTPDGDCLFCGLSIQKTVSPTGWPTWTHVRTGETRCPSLATPKRSRPTNDTLLLEQIDREIKRLQAERKEAVDPHRVRYLLGAIDSLLTTRTWQPPKTAGPA